MPRLSYEKRLRVVTLYEKHELHFQKGRFFILSLICKHEDIIATPLTLRKIVVRWLTLGRIDNLSSRSRAIKHTKITKEELNALDRLILRNRGMSAKRAKAKLNLRASSRTVQKYGKLLVGVKFVPNIASM